MSAIIPFQLPSQTTTYPNVRVTILAVPRNSSLVRAIRLSRAGPANHELSALGVELRSIGLVKGNQLVANEIVSRSKPRRNSASPLLVATNKLGNIPPRRVLRVEEHAVASLEATLINLEPAGARPVAGAEGARALVHPDDDGALGVGPLLPDGADLGAGLDGGGLGGRGAAVAAELGGAARGDGVVVGPLALDHILAVGRGEALVAGVGLAVDDVAGDGTVGVDAGGEEAEGADEGGQHFEFGFGWLVAQEQEM